MKMHEHWCEIIFDDASIQIRPSNDTTDNSRIGDELLESKCPLPAAREQALLDATLLTSANYVSDSPHTICQ